ncbi:hypothetical protein GV828_11280 [Flavobacterium sp. NST-5]|uniref:Glycosyltransferase RgtA/B/C/D-like domain-containing protein n=1 Tax=Flavobacterium ichthyis TaxID=2698827 RepID=A0ABW9ZB79_9FLAO|nr:glycosyltransferase family 39 protein [Flavobacterium ichthyis]NBL65782.1 hypothetical protein [Flavobacterium ichthyis]
MVIANFIKKNFFIIAVLLIAAFLRFFSIGLQEPWLDELSTLQVSDPELSFSQTHELILTREGFPHLYFLSLKFLSSLFGHSIIVARIFSAVFGVASVLTIYLFAKELLNKTTGQIAAVLMTVNFFHIYHSQEGRPYAFMVFLILLASFRLVKYVKNPSFKNAIWVGIATGLIPNAHPMGSLNIAVIYSTLFVFLLISKEKKIIFRQLLFAGIISILIFIPVYQIIAKVSQIKSFWIPEASLATIQQAFFELLGSIKISFYLFLISVPVFIILLIFKIKKDKETPTKKLKIIALSLVSFWIVFNIGVIIVKSYAGISIILNRYFIGSLAMFILTLSYCIALFKPKVLRIVVVIALVVYSLFYIYEREYYTTIYKAEWQSLAKEISKKNVDNDPIYATYGFTSNILFKNTPSYTLLTERKLEDYINMVRNNTVEIEAFWFFDGNQRPYSVSVEDQAFLDENYILDQKIEKHDCWARHYIPKNAPLSGTGEHLKLGSLHPKVLDDQGNLYMFNNETTSTKKIKLLPGKYQFDLQGNSLPEIPLDGENAHIVVRYGDKIIGQDFLSEKNSEKYKSYIFEVLDTLPKAISITFDNDLSRGDLDRNVKLYFISLKRIDN